MILPNRRWRRRPDRPLPLFDSPRPSPAATSRAAAESVAKAVGYIEQRIIDHLEQLGSHGATADEAEVALNLRSATGSARFSEMTKAGRITRTTRTRPTRSGRGAFVHVHPTHGGNGCSDRAS
jgi:hypothetical protein